MNDKVVGSCNRTKTVTHETTNNEGRILKTAIDEKYGKQPKHMKLGMESLYSAGEVLEEWQCGLGTNISKESVETSNVF